MTIFDGDDVQNEPTTRLLKGTVAYFSCLIGSRAWKNRPNHVTIGENLFYEEVGYGIRAKCVPDAESN